jgi:hypothetical protein
VIGFCVLRGCPRPPQNSPLETGGEVAYTPEIGRRFWFEFDNATLHTPAFMDIVRSAGASRAQTDYRDMRRNGTYPAAFKAKFEPRRADWIRIADLQTTMISDLLGGDWADIQAAFEDFGQGVLLDTDPDRVADGDAIHMMDGQVGNPPIGYHRWHACIRAIQMLEIGDAAWWENLDRMVGLGWGVQSLAKPVQQNAPNPPLAQSDLQDLRYAWLALAPERRDRQYDLGAGNGGFHPDPKQPAA